MTVQQDRMREALTPPFHPVDCQCAVCSAIASALPDRVCRECGCTDSAACVTEDGPCGWARTRDELSGICTACAPTACYSELDVAALLVWRSLYADQLIRVAQAAVDELLYTAVLSPVNPAVMRQFVAELEPASAEIPHLGPTRDHGSTSSATPSSR